VADAEVVQVRDELARVGERQAEPSCSRWSPAVSGLASLTGAVYYATAGGMSCLPPALRGLAGRFGLRVAGLESIVSGVLRQSSAKRLSSLRVVHAAEEVPRPGGIRLAGRASARHDLPLSAGERSHRSADRDAWSRIVVVGPRRP
jgi:hypothetical protein